MNSKIIEVGLTGSRKSGKDGVAKMFSSLGIPVFNSDAVVKYLLNYKPSVVKSVEKVFGRDYIFDGYINPLAFNTDEKFNMLIDLIDFELFEAYAKFKNKHKSSYVIFHSSMIFERTYKNKFDFIINVFSPKEDRMERYKLDSGEKMESINSLFSREMDEVQKNKMSDFVIHNYLDAPDILKQIHNIDDTIVGKFLEMRSKLYYDDLEYDPYTTQKSILT